MGFSSSHLHEQQPYDEGRPLAVSDLPVVDGVGLHHVEQRLLADPVLLLEEVMLGVRAGNVPGKLKTYYYSTPQAPPKRLAI